MKFYTSVVRIGGQIKARGYDNDGYRTVIEEKFKPVLFTSAPEEKSMGWRTIYGDSVAPIIFDSMYESSQFIKKYDGTVGFSVLGNTNYPIQWIQRQFPDDIEFDTDQIRIANIDIEVHSTGGFPSPNDAAWPVSAITYYDSVDKKYYVWGQQDSRTKSKVKYQVKRDDVVYVECEDERALLLSFINQWSTHHKTPDIITGWNVEMFDIPYLVNRIKNVLSEDLAKSLSPWNQIQYRDVFHNGQSNDTYKLIGIQTLDYQDLFKKFAVFKYGNQESYSLNHIASTVLGKAKLDYSEHGSLKNLYEEDYQKYIDYNIEDVNLVKQIDDQESYIDIALSMSYRGGVNVSDVMGTVAIWDSIIYRELFKQKVAIPPRVIKDATEFDGAYVKEVEPGMYDNVVSFDLASLYPNIIVQWNISPETIIGRKAMTVGSRQIITPRLHVQEEPFTHELNACIAGDGMQFSTEKQGFLPKIVSEYYDNRKKYKSLMKKLKNDAKANNDNSYETQKKIASASNNEQSIKLLMNSLYGACGNKWFRYFDLRIAEAITKTGQMVILWGEKTVNDFMNKALKNENNTDHVIAIDTDSLYVDFDPLVKAYKKPDEDTIDFLCKMADGPFGKALEEGYDKLFKRTRCMESRMVMDREVVASRAVWTAAKNYAISVWDNEGFRYDEPNFKIMGLAGKKAIASQSVRDAIMEIYRLALYKDEAAVQEYISQVKESFFNFAPQDIAAPRGVNGIMKYTDRNTVWKKGTQAHIRAAIVYNKYLTDLKLTNKYSLLGDGEKMKILYLTMPNKLQSDVVGFIDQIPEEFGINDKIDYDTAFEKTFLSPVKIYLNAIGWELESKPSLDDFWS